MSSNFFLQDRGFLRGERCRAVAPAGPAHWRWCARGHRRGYTFAYASGLITGGRLGDLFGYRRLFLVGMLGFAASSALCGVAGSRAELVAAPIAQGLAAAAMLPQVLALITASVLAGDLSAELAALLNRGPKNGRPVGRLGRP